MSRKIWFYINPTKYGSTSARHGHLYQGSLTLDDVVFVNDSGMITSIPVWAVFETKPRPHAELIHAWAEGAEIEYKTVSEEWRDTLQPTFVDTYEYRIKPQPTVNPKLAEAKAKAAELQELIAEMEREAGG